MVVDSFAGLRGLVGRIRLAGRQLDHPDLKYYYIYYSQIQYVIVYDAKTTYSCCENA